MSKETIQNFFLCAVFFLETQEGAVEDNDDPFKLLQSDLDQLKLLKSKLVPDRTTAKDFIAARLFLWLIL